MLATVFGTLLAVSIGVLLSWKWGLERRKVIPTLVFLGGVAGLVVAALAGNAAFAVRIATVSILDIMLGLAALLFMFHRNPERAAPNRDDVVVSPADGEVIYVQRAEGGKLPISTKAGRRYPLDALTKTSLDWNDAVVIGVAMNFLDVHVNRAPIAGRVTLLQHCRGTFASLKRPESVFENERATTVIKGDNAEVAIVQIASRLVRQIVSSIGEGDQVVLGQRIGMIRFGSQVDVVLPADRYIVVASVGEHVTAGTSVIATLRS